MAETSHSEDLDWDNMANPVPMNLIDSDFAEAVEDIDPPQEARTREFQAMPGSRSEILPRETPESLMSQAAFERPAPDAGIEKAATPGTRDTDAFSGLRAQVEAQAAAEDAAKAKAEEEEAAQRLRLDQWMANARARLQAADEEPKVPGAPVRVRREPSPTLIRLAEMQKTLFEPGEAETLADFQNGSGYKTGKVSLDGADPMATIIVPKDTFVDAPAPQTAKLKSLERKVAQIKRMEAGAETMIMAAPAVEPEKANVRVAVWILGGLIPVVLCLGLFALTRTGYLDGLEDLFPTLTGRTSHGAPKVSPESKPVDAAAEAALATEKSIADMARAASARNQIAEPAAPVSEPAASPAAPSASSAPSAPSGKRAPMVASKAAPQPAPALALAPAPAPKRPPIAKAPAPRVAAPAPARKAKTPPISKAAAQSRPAPVVAASHSAMATAVSALDNARRSAEASMAGVQVAQPSPRNESATSPHGEEALKASVQAALHRDAENVQGIYDRFAMGTPGLTGDVVIGITVEPKGHIVEGSVAASSTGSPAFDQELLRKVLDWKLEPFPDNRTRYVAVPFHFEPKEP